MKLTKVNYFRLLSIILLALDFLPVLINNLPPIIGSYHLYAGLWIISLIIIHPEIVLDRKLGSYYLLSVILFIFLYFVWKDMDDWNKNFIISEIYDSFISLTMLNYYLNKKDYRGFEIIVKLVLLFIFITAILSIYTASINPLYAREVIGQIDSSRDIDLYNRLGGGGFGFVSSIVLLFPIIIYFLRNKKEVFSRYIVLVFLIVITVALIKVQLFANILISFVALFFALFGSRNIYKSLFSITIVFILLIFTPKTVYLDLINDIGNHFERGSENNKKFMELAYYLKTGDDNSGLGQRAIRYPELISAFSKNPIFGYHSTSQVDDISNGGHLYFMNRLTNYGLILFALFILFHISFIRYITKFFSKEYKFYYFLSIVALISLGLMKVLGSREFWATYFLILPGLSFLTGPKSK